VGLLQQVHFPFETLKSSLTDQSCAKCTTGQTLIGVVVSQIQSIFSAAGEHAIWFFCPFSDKIINEDADISFSPTQHQGRAVLDI
jgi:hypothetical protein